MGSSVQYRRLPGGLANAIDRSGIFWASVILASLGLRVLALILLDGRHPDGDTPNFLAMANNLLTGRGLVLDDPNNVANMRVTYPPLYPMLLAGIGLLVPLTMTVVTVVQTIIDGACALLMARLGKAVGKPTVGNLGAAVYLLWPTNIALVPLARKEGLLALLVVSLLLVLVRGIEADRPKSNVRLGLYYGLLSGLLALAQPGLLFLPALFALVAIREFGSPRQWLLMVGIGAACATLVLIPWWIRNWLLFHRFIPLTAASGYSLWIGATPAGNGMWLPPPVEYRTGDEFALSSSMGKEAWRIIAADPMRYVLHCLSKFVRVMISDNRGASMIYWPEPATHLGITRIWVVVATVTHLIVLQLALVGAFLQRRELLTKFLLAGLAYMLLFGIWFEFDQRHRYFATPLLILAAASGVAWMRARLGSRQALADLTRKE